MDGNLSKQQQARYGQLPLERKIKELAGEFHKSLRVDVMVDYMEESPGLAASRSGCYRNNVSARRT